MEVNGHKPQRNKVISDSEEAILTLDTDTNTLTKRLKLNTVNSTAFSLYKKLQEKNNNIVKVLEQIDRHTFTMEYIPNIICNLEDLLAFYRLPYPEKYKEEVLRFTKNDIINAMVTIQSIWLDGLELSKELSNDEFFIHGDLKFGNVAVIRNIPNNLGEGPTGYSFKVLDPDSCWIVQGYHGTEQIERSLLRLSKIWTEIKLYQSNHL